MKKVLVIFGGVSSEHDVSCVSAKSVISNIPAGKYETLIMGISKDGKWYLYDGSIENLPEDKWLEDKAHLTPAILSPDREHHGVIRLDGANKGVERVDVIFPVLHGKNGEDGTIQGLFALSGIPFVGCDTLSSAICMDKALTNAVADYHGIKQAKWCSFLKYDYEKDADKYLDDAISALSLPIFVKPANAGSSVGVSKAKTKQELREACEKAFVHDRKIVLEECITGHEVECAVMGNNEPIASTVGEIKPANEFYDYDAKYLIDSGLLIPASIPAEGIEKVREAACRAFKAFGCSGLARIDFFYTADGQVYLNEPNTIPGFTSISMYPMLFGAVGVPYGELLDRLITLAIER